MRVAVSGCLCGHPCRYDGADNHDLELLETLKGATVIPFCPEDAHFGTPRPTMDLIQKGESVCAVSNTTHQDLSDPIRTYAREFFDQNEPFDLYIGKDRSPSCGVHTAKLYDETKNLISTQATGLMSEEALTRGIVAYDANDYLTLSQ